MGNPLRQAASSALWGLCRALPVKSGKIVLCSYGGKGFGGNPKAIALKLLESGRDLDLVWLTRGKDPSLPKGIRPCPFGSPQAVMELSTARVWVDDSRGGAKFKKKNQFYLQTWHGFPLKHIEAAAQDHLPESYIRQCKKDSAFIDLLVSNSSFMTRVYREDFWYDGEIGEFGSPRNDLFFQPHPQLSQKVRSAFGLPEGQKLLLYAPTFRADGSVEAYCLDTARILTACRVRFGGQWSVLIRLHPNAAALSKGLFPYDGSSVLDATAYPDMQELLAAVDILVTDYSSSMFDYALQNKPCFQFAPDLEAYRQDRNFYFPLDQLPFPVAQTNEALASAIESFDPGAQKSLWDRFAVENGIREDGQAAQRCAQWILDRL